MYTLLHIPILFAARILKSTLGFFLGPQFIVTAYSCHVAQQVSQTCFCLNALSIISPAPSHTLLASHPLYNDLQEDNLRTFGRFCVWLFLYFKMILSLSIKFSSVFSYSPFQEAQRVPGRSQAHDLLYKQVWKGEVLFAMLGQLEQQ